MERNASLKGLFLGKETTLIQNQYFQEEVLKI